MAGADLVAAIIRGLPTGQRAAMRELAATREDQPVPRDSNVYWMMAERRLQPDVYARMGDVVVMNLRDTNWRFSALGLKVRLALEALP